MKKILYTIFVSFIAFFAMPAFTAQAQGNLQFNQVITFNFPLNSGALSSIYTVPVGKVWKLEAISGSSSSSTSASFMQINGTNVPIGNTPPSVMNAIWLKSGDQFAIYNGYGLSAGYFCSILEFNIVP
jgi:hypothetical protein